MKKYVQSFPLNLLWKIFCQKKYIQEADWWLRKEKLFHDKTTNFL